MAKSDQELHLEIDDVFSKTKEQFYKLFSLINQVSHEENRREFNCQASRIYESLDRLQDYIRSR